jgi:hypothetical protein
MDAVPIGEDRDIQVMANPLPADDRGPLDPERLRRGGNRQRGVLHEREHAARPTALACASLHLQAAGHQRLQVVRIEVGADGACFLRTGQQDPARPQQVSLGVADRVRGAAERINQRLVGQRVLDQPGEEGQERGTRIVGVAEGVRRPRQPPDPRVEHRACRAPAAPACLSGVTGLTGEAFRCPLEYSPVLHVAMVPPARTGIPVDDASSAEHPVLARHDRDHQRPSGRAERAYARGYQPGLRVVGRLAAAVTGEPDEQPPTVCSCIAATGVNVRFCIWCSGAQ